MISEDIVIIQREQREAKSLYGFEHFNELLMLSDNNDMLFNRDDRKHSIRGKPIGALNDSGYMVFELFGYDWRVHRVIWLLYYKKWPEKFLDHINTIKTDNSILNLRESTKSENGQNRKKQSNNTSGHKCISFCNHYNKWRVRVGVNHKFFGAYHKTLEDAIKARDELVTQLHGDFANLS